MELILTMKSLNIPVSFSCEYMGISRAAFYKWETHRKTARLTPKDIIKSKIQKVFKESRETYGSPRIYEELRVEGISVSENTVAKYMQEMKLDARFKKKFKVQTTDSNHNGPIADRLFKVEDHHHLPQSPGSLLAGDITYLRLGGSFIYLAVVMDLYTREIVGWSMSRSLKTQLVLDALDSAMHVTSPDAEVIFHSDRGSQYASDAYRKMLKNHDIKPSMSRKGNCYDNSYVESWFGSLKKDLIYRREFSTESDLRNAVFEYIEVWYNRKRKHSSLGYMSPEQFKMSNQFA